MIIFVFLKEKCALKPGKRFKTVLVIVIVVIAAILIGVAVYVGRILNKVNHVAPGTAQERIPRSEETFEVNTSEPDTIKQEEIEELFDVDSIDMMENDSIKNILLIGQDAREGEERQRSDTMIICSINTHTDKVLLASLMRDMYVPIPGYSNNRINAAYVFGGMELLDEVIEQDFGIPIDGNIEVDFEGFVEAMDVIGGVDIELTAEEAGYLSAGGWEDQGEYANDGTWELQPGMNTLTPPQALAFSRIRHVGNSDWERTDRQRRVIMAAFSKISSSSTAKLLSIADSILPYITTDLSNKELLGYVKTLSVAGITDFESYRIPADGYYSSENIGGMSVLVPDLPKNSELLKEYIYGDDFEPEFKDKEKSDDQDGEDEKEGNTKTKGKTKEKNSSSGRQSRSGSTGAGSTGSSGSYSGNANTYNPNTYTPNTNVAPANTPAPAPENPAPDTGGNTGADTADNVQDNADTGNGADPGSGAETPDSGTADQGGANGGTNTDTAADTGTGTVPSDTGGGDANVQPAVPEPAAPEPAPVPDVEVPLVPDQSAAQIPAEGGA